MVEPMHCPVQTSAVYVLGQSSFPAIPPPSPPSPVTPADTAELCDPIEELCLDEAPAESAASADDDTTSTFSERLAGAVHVLNTEATALRNLTELYTNDAVARDGFNRAVAAITRHHQDDSARGGKLVVIGVGKSGHIAKKLVASFNSLGVQAQFLHPTEALHGDLGQIGPHDTFLLITFSGKTPELMLLLPHLDPRLPLVLLTSHTRPDTCELIRHRPDIILLPSPIHEAETVSFGVSAPTTSTTAALSIGDALAIVAAHELYPSVSAVFAKNHPGGAIGAVFAKQGAYGKTAATSSPPSAPSSSASSSPSSPSPAAITTTTTTTASASSQTMNALQKENTPIRKLAVPLAELPCLCEDTATGADVLRAGYAAPSGWVRLSSSAAASSSAKDVISVVNPARIRALGSTDLALPLAQLGWAVTRTHDAVSVASNTKVQQAVAWIRGMRAAAGAGQEDECECGDDAVVAVLERGECVAVLEVGELMREE